MARILGGDVLARRLQALGVKEVFALHGGHRDAYIDVNPVLFSSKANGAPPADQRVSAGSFSEQEVHLPP